MVFLSEAYASSAAGGMFGSSFLGILKEFAPFVLVGLIFYFLVLRPQNQQRAALTAQLQQLAVGSQVMCRGGYFAVVVSVEGDVLGLQLSPGTLVYVARGAVEKVFQAGEEKKFPKLVLQDKGGEVGPKASKSAKKTV